MKKIIVRATQDLGKYLFACLKPAIEQLGYEAVKFPQEGSAFDFSDVTLSIDQCRSVGIEELAALQSYIKNNEVEFILYFTDWKHRWPYVDPDIRNFFPEEIQIPKVFWSREDPYHFYSFTNDALYADLICTSEELCIHTYQKLFPTKKIICTPMALAPEIFYPAELDYDRYMEIVFVGNRYHERASRDIEEKTIMLPAVAWAKANNHRIEIFGKGTDEFFGWKKQPEIWEFPGVYHWETDRLQAANVYRSSIVALSYGSVNSKGTMVPNRLLHAVGCGCVTLSYDTPAARKIINDHAFFSLRPEDTWSYLNIIFGDLEKAREITKEARQYLLDHHTFKHRLISILEALKA